jgi:hypothetical protein
MIDWNVGVATRKGTVLGPPEAVFYMSEVLFLHKSRDKSDLIEDCRWSSNRQWSSFVGVINRHGAAPVQ